jgi:hypothetical protein
VLIRLTPSSSIDYLASLSGLIFKGTYSVERIIPLSTKEVKEINDGDQPL